MTITFESRSASTPLIVTSLPELAVIRVTGEDAPTFLQGQLTQDIIRQPVGSLTIAGLCSPQGRLLAVFRVIKQETDFLLLVPKDIVDMTVKRLRMYVLRAKVVLSILEDTLVVGLIGTLPERYAGQSVYALSDAAPETRLALNLPAGRGIALMASDQAPSSSSASSLFWAATIAAGDPWIHLPCRDQFTAHAINLECVAGVHFAKGCYTGQEIVSRVEHIGKPPRRAALFALSEAFDLPLMSEVLLDSTPVGDVFMATTYANRTVLLAVLRSEDLSSPSLSVQGRTITPLALPYEYKRSNAF